MACTIPSLCSLHVGLKTVKSHFLPFTAYSTFGNGLLPMKLSLDRCAHRLNQMLVRAVWRRSATTSSRRSFHSTLVWQTGHLCPTTTISTHRVKATAMHGAILSLFHCALTCKAERNHHLRIGVLDLDVHPLMSGCLVYSGEWLPSNFLWEHLPQKLLSLGTCARIFSHQNTNSSAKLCWRKQAWASCPTDS